MRFLHSAAITLLALFLQLTPLISYAQNSTPDNLIKSIIENAARIMAEDRHEDTTLGRLESPEERAGFVVLALSDFVPTVMFGLFNALAMVMGQFAALTVLPSLFLLTGLPRGPSEEAPPGGSASSPFGMDDG